ncbi:(d)CMP kinase [candidate division GN15 bacterium]|nr:(d)CMP kinase [candidate division GN15 bacterium]
MPQSQSQYNLSRLKGKVIAIDGPAGSGKSTTAKLVAARLGYRYLDTGAMYRALTWLALQHEVSLGDEAKLQALAKAVTIDFETSESENRVFINGHDVTLEIRTPEITRNVSQVAAHRAVRRAMVEKQQQMAREGSIVAEGRDTTTVVFPDADLKVYLDADLHRRAERRLIDMAKMGVSTSVHEVEADLARRDKLDSEREHSPLQRAKDAKLIDTSDITIEGQVERVLSLLKAVFA